MVHRPFDIDIDRVLTICCALIFFLALLVIVLILREPDRLTGSQEVQHGKEIELGAALYDTHCRSCHGIRGEGVGQLGPPLADNHFFTKRLQEVGWNSTLRAYIISSTEHGRMMGTRPIYAGNGSTAVMPGWLDRHGGPLRSDQIHLIVSFIANWEATALGNVTLAEIELPTISLSNPKTIGSGKEVFRRACASCHIFQDISPSRVPGPELDTITGKTLNENGPETLEEFIHDSVLIPELEVTEGFRQISDSHPCGATLTVTELNDVTAFLLQ